MRRVYDGSVENTRASSSACGRGSTDAARLLPSCFLLLAPRRLAAQAQPAGQRFVSVAFHDVVDRGEELDDDAVTTRTLVQFFDWLKGTGWTAVSLDDIAAAARGTRPLPDKAILLTFDDGYRSLYTRVFPLLQAYRFPVVAALVGKWMEGAARRQGALRRRSRAAQPLHLVGRGARDAGVGPGRVRLAQLRPAPRRAANPQGNMTPAAAHLALRSFDRRYETDAQYRARIRADLQRSRQQMAANSAGRRAPWSGRSAASPDRRSPRPRPRLHLRAHARARARRHADLFGIHRFYPSMPPWATSRATCASIPQPATRRIACLTLDALAAAGPGPARTRPRRHDRGRAQPRRQHGRDRCPCGAARPGSAARRCLLSDAAAADARRPPVARHLADAHARRRRRLLRLPLRRARRGGRGGPAALFADMRATPSPMAWPSMATPTGQRIVADLPGDIRARRAALDLATLDPSCAARAARLSRGGVDRPAAAPDARSSPPGGPPDWADWRCCRR